MTSLRKIEIRSNFLIVKSRLGEPNTTDSGPPSESCQLFIHTWNDLHISVLTWLTDDGEWVWGVRNFGAVGIESELGFGIGSAEATVRERLPPNLREESGQLSSQIGDCWLTISIHDGQVNAIQILGPMADP